MVMVVVAMEVLLLYVVGELARQNAGITSSIHDDVGEVWLG